MIRTALSTADVTLTAIAPLVHRCPFVDEVDNGTVTISWRVDGQTFELHSLRAYLDRFRDAEISHEAITDRIRHDLATTLGLADVTVTTTWDTAGMEVTCSTSPTPAGSL